MAKMSNELHVDPYDDEKRYDSIGGVVPRKDVEDQTDLTQDPDALYDKGLLLNFKKDYDGAITCLEKAQTVYQNQRNFLGSIRCLIELAWLKYNENSDEGTSRASRTFAEAQEMVDIHMGAKGINEVRARLLHYKGLVKYRSGQYGEGVRFFRQAKTFCWQDGLEAAKINDSLGIHYERTGDFHLAVKCLESSVRIKEQLDLPWEEAVTAQILGRLHLIKEDYIHAYGCLNRSLTLSESLGDSKRVTSLKNELIKLAIHQGELTEAKRLIQGLAEEHHDQKKISKEFGVTLLFKAFIHFIDREFNESHALLTEQVIPIFKKKQAKKGLGKSYRLLARLQAEFGDTQKALETMGEALAIFKQLNLVDEQAKTYFEFGKVFMEMNDKKLALESLMEALKVAEQNGLRFLASYIEDELYRTDTEQWQSIVDKRANHEKIFQNERGLLEALNALSEVSSDSPETSTTDPNEITLKTEEPPKNISSQAKSVVSLLRVGQAMFAERDIEKLLKLIMDETRLALTCDRCTVFLYDREQNELWSKVGTGLEESHEIRFPAHLGLAGYVCKTGEILNITDAYDDPRFNKDVDKKTGYKTDNLLCMPMRNRHNEIIGVFQVLNKTKGHFERVDEDLLMAIASQAGVAIENAQLVEEQRVAFSSFVKALSSTIDSRDPITAGHSERVAQYSKVVGKQMHLQEEELETLNYSALLHDIGKIGVPENILTKDGRLTDLEYRKIQEHAQNTYDILSNIRFEKHLRRVPEIAASHHEKMNGTGYPKQLKGPEIPLLGRVIALSDVFDAITSRRHYRDRMPFDRVLKILRKDSGTHFDPDCVGAFFDTPLIEVGKILMVEKRVILSSAGITIIEQFDPSITIEEYYGITLKSKLTKGEVDLMRQFREIYHRGELDDLS